MRICTIALLTTSAVSLAVPAFADSGTAAPLPAELAAPATPSGQEVAQATASPATAAAPSYETGIAGYFDNWFARSDAAKASQPHWMTPLVTVTPRLEQEVRYDQYWEHQGNGANVDQYDSGKGVELIPDDTNEILLNPPPYLDRSVKKPAQGWNDWGFLTVKQRLLSGNEDNGDYILTAFLGFQADSGNAAFTNHSWLITPTIAAGKGWGDFDIQSTLGVSFPLDYGAIIGDALAWNTAFQYHLGKVFWPEFETNLTHWFGGERDGKTQVFLTPGVIFGRFQLAGRVNGSIGIGYQFAVTPKETLEPVLTPTYQHAWLISVRAAF